MSLAWQLDATDFGMLLDGWEITPTMLLEQALARLEPLEPRLNAFSDHALSDPSFPAEVRDHFGIPELCDTNTRGYPLQYCHSPSSNDDTK